MGIDPRQWRGLAGVRRGLILTAASELSNDFSMLRGYGGDGGGYPGAYGGERGFRDANPEIAISRHEGANNPRHPRQIIVKRLKTFTKHRLSAPPNHPLKHRQTPANPRQ